MKYDFNFTMIFTFSLLWAGEPIREHAQNSILIDCRILAEESEGVKNHN